MTDVQLAWIVGIFEGEGCSYIRGASRIVLEIQMTDRDVIERVQTYTRVGTISSRPLPSGKTVYIWSVGKCDDAADLLRKMLPHLGDRRRRKADSLLSKWDESVKPKRMWTHCIHGHAFAGRNLVLQDGRRRCRTCRNERTRRYRARLALQ